MRRRAKTGGEAVKMRRRQTFAPKAAGRRGLPAVGQETEVASPRPESGVAEGKAECERAEALLTATDKVLPESEVRFRELADNISQFVWTADAKGWIYWYNKRWHDYTGTTLADMEGWGWQKVHHPDHVDRVVNRIRQSFETGTPWEDTFPLRGKDGPLRPARAAQISADFLQEAARQWKTDQRVTDCMVYMREVLEYDSEQTERFEARIIRQTRYCAELKAWEEAEEMRSKT